MSRPTAQEDISRQVRAVSDLPREALIERWVAVYGGPPPKGISRRLLEGAAAYHLQAAAFGGLDQSTRRRLCRRAVGGERPSSDTEPRRPISLSSGTRLVREWNGRIHTVEVIDGGFQWNGHQWGSLSAVATAITGTKWSGPRFFGL